MKDVHEEILSFVDIFSTAIKSFYDLDPDIGRIEFCFFQKENIKVFLMEFLFEQENI